MLQCVRILTLKLNPVAEAQSWLSACHKVRISSNQSLNCREGRRLCGPQAQSSHKMTKQTQSDQFLIPKLRLHGDCRPWDALRCSSTMFYSFCMRVLCVCAVCACQIWIWMVLSVLSPRIITTPLSPRSPTGPDLCSA